MPSEVREQGKCQYCGKELPDVANIRCEQCDRAFSDGVKRGSEILQEKIRSSVKLFINIVNNEYSA
jgi:predicted amidophosphoribosyltransferase